MITDINNEGEGVVRVGDERFVLFVPDALPGEEVTCRVTRVKKNYGTAKALERHNDSPDRTPPRCPHFGRCGGCQLQHMNYDAQLRLKTKTVIDALTRIGGIEKPPVENCVPSPSQWGYRNKASLPVQNFARGGFIAGFYKPRSHDIVPFETCPVLLPKLEVNIKTVLSYLQKTNLTNFIRHIIFRTAQFTDESLCGVVGSRNLRKTEIEELKKLAAKNSSLINGLIYNKNISEGNFIWGDEFTTLYGASVMKEAIGDFKYTFEISSFFQINSAQTQNLYKQAAELALEGSPQNILELYSGVGSLTAYLAKGAKSVTAVESWEPAAKYMKENAAQNNLSNITPHSGRAEDIAAALAENKYDAVVLDPPRTGCQPEVIDAIVKISPKRIVYVSCNPATLARDIKPLTANGYELTSAQPFDMFPQTGHVETVCQLSREQFTKVSLRRICLFDRF